MKSIVLKSIGGFLVSFGVLLGAQAAVAEIESRRAPSAKLTAKLGAIVRQVRLDGEWSSAEAFVVLPGRTIQMRLIVPEVSAPSHRGGPASSSAEGAARTFSLATSSECRWKIPYGTPVSLKENQLEWVVPTGPGHYEVVCEIERHNTLRWTLGEASEKSRELPPLRASMTFHILVPFELDPEGRGVIEGYPIGVYPRETAENVKAVIAAHRNRYRPPRWFVAVTPETRDLHVSEHFRLGDFVPSAAEDVTAYFPYNANLCRALEAMLVDLRKSGVTAPRLRIVRGFVSPYDAERLRRQGIRLLRWNRYQYGDAALIIVDRDGDSKMDDLDGDGMVDMRDAEVLSRVVSGVQRRLGLSGWIGIYGQRSDKTLPETPMVGFDLRGWWVETYRVGPSLGGE